MTPLTERQQEIMTMIRDFIVDSGMPPTRVEISEHFGFKSANAAEDHLKALVKKGAITVKAGTARGIQIADEFDARTANQMYKMSRIMDREFGKKVGGFVRNYADNLEK